MKLNKQISLKWTVIAISLMAIISLASLSYVASLNVGEVSEVWVQPPFSEASYVIGQ